MKQTIPKWLEDRYSILWDAFGEKPFRHDDALAILKDKKTAKQAQVLVVLSELHKSGRLNIEPDPEDGRKRIYKLISRKAMLERVFSVDEGTLNRSDVEGLLKKAADLIRTRVDYKFILVLLFLKRISDKWELEYENAYREALKEGFNESEAKKEASNSAYHDFELPEQYRWENIRKDVATLPEHFSTALKKLSELNPQFKDVLGDLDFIQFATSRENADILRQLVELFSEKRLHHVSPDILGDAYEWILRYFAPQKAKEGEVYTPREVIRLLVEILDPKPGESVYDPASASNGMLIISYKYVEEKLGRNKAEKLFLYGQELNLKTLALGKMNLYIHDIKNANIASGDTLLYPKFKDSEKLKTFDVVIANPPWSQDGYPEESLTQGEFWKQRFKYGFGPAQYADWAWIQHMLASTDGQGRIGVVIDNGCLFRGGKERAIRSKVLDEDLVECVMLLPEKLFYNTGAPGAVMFFNRKKAPERKGKVLFINASAEFEKHPDVRKLNHLSDGNIERIVKAFREFGGGSGFAESVSLEKIRENDYNLNVTLYAFPHEKEEEIDVQAAWNDVKAVEKEIGEVEDRLSGYLKEIGYDG